MNEVHAVDGVPAFQPDVLAEALVHLLWQGVGVGLVAALFLLMSSRIGAAGRATAMGACLAVFPLVLAVTYFVSVPVAVVQSGAPGGEVSWAWVRNLLGSLVGTIPPWPWVLGVWGVGVLAFGVRAALGLTRIRRLARAVDRLDASECGAPEGVSQHPSWRAYESRLASHASDCRVIWVAGERLEMPCTLGVRHPRILVPRQVLDARGGVRALDVDDLVLILEHEWAHVRRHDFLANLTQVFLEVVFFFHPVVWWLSSRLRVEREFACDDEAMAALPSEPGLPRRYARALGRLAERCGSVPALLPSAVGGSVVGRMARLIEGSPAAAARSRGNRWPRALALVPAIGGLAISVGAVGLAPPKGPRVPSYLDPSREPCFELPFVGPFGHHGSWEVFYGEGFRFRPGSTARDSNSGSGEAQFD